MLDTKHTDTVRVSQAVVWVNSRHGCPVMLSEVLLREYLDHRESDDTYSYDDVVDEIRADYTEWLVIRYITHRDATK